MEISLALAGEVLLRYVSSFHEDRFIGNRVSDKKVSAERKVKNKIGV